MLHPIVRGVALAAIVLAAMWALAPAASAQTFDRKTIITVNQPFQLPGVTLPAGTYVMKIMDLAGIRTVVRVTNEAEDKVYATIIGINDYKLEPSEKTDISFYEASPGLAPPVHAWFYPGANYGVEFVYPEREAIDIAKMSGEHVMATPEVAVSPEPEPTEEPINEPIFAVQPSGEEVEAAVVHPEMPPEPVVEPAAAEEAPAEELPKTATPFALLGLMGFVAATTAAGVRVVRKRR